tara:strand:+ start:4189 stop:4419 length:231 start_codon:yes stop_codon:yes gene_type:complete
MEPYGWLNTLYDVAKTGLFTKHPHNAVDSVRLEDLYIIFTYISYKTAVNEYENEVRKGMEQEQKHKMRANNNRTKF